MNEWNWICTARNTRRANIAGALLSGYNFPVALRGVGTVLYCEDAHNIALLWRSVSR